MQGVTKEGSLPCEGEPFDRSPDHSRMRGQEVPPRLGHVAVTPTPSEEEAMAPGASRHTRGKGGEPPRLYCSPLQAQEMASFPHPTGEAPLRPVFSSDSLMALAARESFSGLGSANDGMPAYPGIPAPRMVSGLPAPSAAYANLDARNDERPHGSPPAALLASCNAAPQGGGRSGMADASSLPPVSQTSGLVDTSFFMRGFSHSKCSSIDSNDEDRELAASVCAAVDSSASTTDLTALASSACAGIGEDFPATEPAAPHSEGMRAAAAAASASAIASAAAAATVELSSSGRPIRSSRGHRRARSDETSHWSANRRSRDEPEEGEQEAPQLGRGRRTTNQPKRHHAQTPEPLDEDEDKPGRGNAQVHPWTPSEDARILQGVRESGCRWSLIAHELPGRSDNAVRNRWHRLEKAERQRREAMEAGQPIEGYRCRRCGQFKKGHMCPGLEPGGAAAVNAAGKQAFPNPARGNGGGGNVATEVVGLDAFNADRGIGSCGGGACGGAGNDSCAGGSMIEAGLSCADGAAQFAASFGGSLGGFAMPVACRGSAGSCDVSGQGRGMGGGGDMGRETGGRSGDEGGARGMSAPPILSDTGSLQQSMLDGKDPFGAGLFSGNGGRAGDNGDQGDGKAGGCASSSCDSAVGGRGDASGSGLSSGGAGPGAGAGDGGAGMPSIGAGGLPMGFSPEALAAISQSLNNPNDPFAVMLRNLNQNLPFGLVNHLNHMFNPSLGQSMHQGLQHSMAQGIQQTMAQTMHQHQQAAAVAAAAAAGMRGQQSHAGFHPSASHLAMAASLQAMHNAGSLGGGNHASGGLGGAAGLSGLDGIGGMPPSLQSFLMGGGGGHPAGADGMGANGSGMMGAMAHPGSMRGLSNAHALQQHQQQQQQQHAQRQQAQRQQAMRQHEQAQRLAQQQHIQQQAQQRVHQQQVQHQAQQQAQQQAAQYHAQRQAQQQALQRAQQHWASSAQAKAPSASPSPSRHMPSSPDDSLLQSIPVDMLDAFLAMDDGGISPSFGDRALSSLYHEGHGDQSAAGSEQDAGLARGANDGGADTDNA